MGSARRTLENSTSTENNHSEGYHIVHAMRPHTRRALPPVPEELVEYASRVVIYLTL